MIYVTMAIVLALIIIALGLHAASLAFEEFESTFMITMMLILIFIIGAGIYLSFAVPTLATKANFLSGNHEKQNTTQITQDEPTGIQFEE